MARLVASIDVESTFACVSQSSISTTLSSLNFKQDAPSRPLEMIVFGVEKAYRTARAVPL
jgi:hypothetical protein